MASILCLGMLLSCSIPAFAYSDSEQLTNTIVHISDEAFTGYEGLETTVSGKVGFNYVIMMPDDKKDIRIGFNPYLTTVDSYNHTFYDIGSGWTIKLPFLEVNDDAISFYAGNGYQYAVENHSGDYLIMDYPMTHNLSRSNQYYVLEEAYGAETLHAIDGFLVSSLPDKADFDDLSLGMSRDEVLEKDPSSYIHSAYTYHRFSDLSMLRIEYEESAEGQYSVVDYYDLDEPVSVLDYLLPIDWLLIQTPLV